VAKVVDTGYIENGDNPTEHSDIEEYDVVIFSPLIGMVSQKDK
jgi:hypothetical protein